MNKKDIIDYFNQLAVGITVVHLRSVYKKGANLIPDYQLDYHLHMLISYNEKIKSGNILCLDTQDIVTRPSDTLNDFKGTVSTDAIDLARTFVDRINSAVKSGKTETGIIFDRAPSGLWELYNDIKQTTFIENVKRIPEKLPIRIENGDDFVNHTDSPDDLYDWAEIRLVEERLLTEKEIPVQK